ncbi:hypothetical protein CMU30_03780 [Elizabethkingia anophelis]|nr:hypothetical protein [Elizabethkingia anophelis]MDV3684752.1 hypothetical protein [Elizabethkingia anophelis]MDV3699561.1 hypothetical protein [Elizabethkingia anophelis]MDV3761938.1 hypothetical protein [Elizabethkingia anophelis]MDV3800655.1 hypothetical protein [Elizabethkingia anophelis]
MQILSTPTTWKQLQEFVAQILKQCSFNVEIEKTIEDVRGNVEIDVLAEEIIDNRKYKIICECKYWKNNIPQLYIQALRTIVADLGANAAYIITTSNFQKGAFESAKYTNVELLTWEDFQKKFFESWYINYFSPHLHNIITSKYDPLAIHFFEDFQLISRENFSKLITAYNQLIEIANHFPHHILKIIPNQSIDIEDKLPIIDKINQNVKDDWKLTNCFPPDEIIRETNYSILLEKIEILANSVYFELDKLNLNIDNED